MKTLINSLYLIIIVFLFLKCASAPAMMKIEDKKIAVPAQKYSGKGLQLNKLEIVDSSSVSSTDTTILIWEGEIESNNGRYATTKAKFNKITEKLDLEVIVPEDTLGVPDTNTYINPQEEAKTEFKFWAYWILGVLVLIVILLFVWKAK